MLDATLSSAGLRVLKLLIGNPPQSIPDLVKATGVTRTAITEQLNELVASGLVEQAVAKLGYRGRPRHTYTATTAAMTLLFADHQHLVVPAIWQALYRVGGVALAKRVMKEVSQALADHYSARITAKKPKDRLRRLLQLFREEGGLVEVAHENGRMVVNKRSCPFVNMIDEERTICTIDLDMMSTVVGRRIRRTACRHDGDPCCTIEIAD
jgi:predicted ArsR family transcriptional regulator